MCYFKAIPAVAYANATTTGAATMIVNATPSRAEVRRNARLRRADRKADSILFEESRPIDAGSILEADRKATVRFNLALLAAFAAIVAAALCR